MEGIFSGEFTPFKIERIVYYTGVKIPSNFYPDQNTLMRHVLFRQNQNMNTFILVVGAVRTGKSYFALKFAERYCELKEIPFNVWNNVSFDIRPFLLWSKTSTKGIFILDEVGCNLNPTEWYTIQAKVFRNFTQAQGFRNNILIMVLPNIAFLLKAVRFMCNYIVQTRNQGCVSISKINMDHALGKGWHDYLGNIFFPLPSNKTIEDYEKMKKEWNDKHLEQDLDYMDMLDKPDYSSELRQKRLELDVKIKEKKLEKLSTQTTSDVWE